MTREVLQNEARAATPDTYKLPPNINKSSGCKSVHDYMVVIESCQNQKSTAEFWNSLPKKHVGWV